MAMKAYVLCFEETQPTGNADEFVFTMRVSFVDDSNGVCDTHNIPCVFLSADAVNTLGNKIAASVRSDALTRYGITIGTNLVLIPNYSKA